jgi:omega-6 fatty acid desaturase (delta-12 desaturase)
MTLSIAPETANVPSPNFNKSDLKLKHIISSLPKEVFLKDSRKAWQQAITSLIMAALGYLAIAVSPWYLLPFAWIFTGTALTGFFVIGHDCAHRSFSNSRRVNDIVGHLYMLPLIYPFHGWRYGHNHHHKHTNKLDVDNAWQPWKQEVYSELGWGMKLTYQAMRGKLWWLASIAHWAVVHFDWRKFPEGKVRNNVRFSALFVIIGAAIGFPIIIATLGWWGFVKFWLLPWLVYHFWMSTFTIVHHTIPEIPFTPASEWNEALAQLEGTVHCDYPRWVEFLCHDINVHLPHHISTAIPSYNLRKATQILRDKWGDKVDLKDRKFSWALMKEITEKCHLYDADNNYLSFQDFARK